MLHVYLDINLQGVLKFFLIICCLQVVCGPANDCGYVISRADLTTDSLKSLSTLFHFTLSPWTRSDVFPLPLTLSCR